jgi:hypothetical protein
MRSCRCRYQCGDICSYVLMHIGGENVKLQEIENSLECYISEDGHVSRAGRFVKSQRRNSYKKARGIYVIIQRTKAVAWSLLRRPHCTRIGRGRFRLAGAIPFT